LRAALVLAILLTATGGAAAAEKAATTPPVTPDTVRVTAEQMHQLTVVKVKLYPFRVQKTAIGQIAFNEDASTVVLTPFSGRVTRVISTGSMSTRISFRSRSMPQRTCG